MEYRCLTDLEQIKEYVDNDRPIAFDFETSPNELYRREDKAALDAHKAHIVGISFSVDEGDQLVAEHLFKKIMSESGRFGKIKLDGREFISGSHFCLECKT